MDLSIDLLKMKTALLQLVHVARMNSLVNQLETSEEKEKTLAIFLECLNKVEDDNVVSIGCYFKLLSL